MSTNIKVRKPFQPEGDEKKRSSKPKGEERILHPEYEEKPVVEPASKTSEDFHGGDELTFSIQDSSQPNENNEQQSSSNSGSSSGLESGEQKEGGGQAETEQEEESEKLGGSAEEEFEEEGGEASEEESKEREGGDEKREEEENSESNGEESGEESENQEERSENGEDNEGESESDDEEGEEENESEEEEEDNEYEEDSEEENDEQGHSHQYNTQQAFDIDLFPNQHKIKRYQTEFYRFLEMIAEDKTKIFDPYSAEEYNINKLMFRQFERKPLSSYRMAKIRDSVVLILDNSGSMVWWSNNISLLADLAIDRNDVEIYLAPNGEIEEMIAPKRKHVSHSKVMQRLKGRKIIYVGDFDGADTPIELSWSNDVIWICPESRYEHFEEHDWVHYNENDYKGAFLRVFNLDQMFKAFKKVLSNPRIWVEEPQPE